MAALKRAQTFDIHRLTQQLVDVYHQAIADYQSGRTVQVRKTPAKQH